MGKKEQRRASAQENESVMMEDVYSNRKFFRHPRALAVLSTGNLFNSIAWASFNAVFIYYLYTPFSKGLGFTQGEAASIISAMGVANSLFLIVGSWLADRFLGMRSALIIGNLVKALGFALLAVPAANVDQGKIMMVLALICLSMPIMGSSNSSLTAQLYHRTDDARRDAAFNMHNIFNSIGGLLAPVVGNLSMKNYHIAFGLASIAALLYGMCILVFSKRFFGELGHRTVKPLLKELLRKMGIISAVVALAAFIAGYFIISTGNISFNRLLNLLTSMAFIIPILFFSKLFLTKKSRKTREKYSSRCGGFWRFKSSSQSLGPLPDRRF